MDDQKNLLNRNVEIALSYTDIDTCVKNGQPIPQLPLIRGKLIKRVFSWTWCYIMELSKPLVLDMKGISEKARIKKSASYILVTPSLTYSNDRVDNMFIKLVELKDSSVNVSIAYVRDPLNVPTELKTGDTPDPYFKEMPSISSGSLRLIN